MHKKTHKRSARGMDLCTHLVGEMSLKGNTCKIGKFVMIFVYEILIRSLSFLSVELPQKEDLWQFHSVSLGMMLPSRGDHSSQTLKASAFR